MTNGAKILHLKKIQPGEVIDVVRQLRRFLATADSTALILSASFAEIEVDPELGLPDLQDLVQKARLSSERAAARLQYLLQGLEKSKPYVEQRQERLARNKKDNYE